MSAVLPDPMAASYRDPKKPLWLLPALIPAITAGGPLAAPPFPKERNLPCRRH